MSQNLPLSIPTQFAEIMDTEAEKAIKRASSMSSKDMGKRPFRASDLNPALTVTNRHFQTSNLGATETYIYNATAGKQLETDTYYLIFGFRVIQGVVPLSPRAMLTIYVDNVFKSELPLAISNPQSENAILALDSLIWVEASQEIEIKIRNPGGPVTDALIIPIGYVIQPIQTAKVK